MESDESYGPPEQVDTGKHPLVILLKTVVVDAMAPPIRARYLRSSIRACLSSQLSLQLANFLVLL